MDKTQLDLLLRNPQASSTENLRIKVSLIVLALVAIATFAFIISYIVTARYELIPLALFPFLLPSVLAYYFLRRTRSYWIILGTLCYLCSTMGLMNLSSAPDYLVDYFLMPVYIGACFLTLKFRHAAYVVCYLLLLYVVTAAIVYWYEPFPILYTNENQTSVLLGFFVSVIISGVMFYFFAKNYQHNSELLNNAIVALNKINDDNKLLINVVSHDFRNYLVRVLLQVEDGKKHMKEDVQVLQLDHVETSIHQLSDLLNEVQRVRDLYQNQDDEELIELSFTQIMKKIRLIFRLQMYQKEIDFELKGASDLKLKINADVFIHVILANLIGNAIKFSPPGGRISMELEDSNGIKRLKISNQAQAMQLENLEKVMRGQERLVSLPGTREESGQGLGISIVKRFCLAYGIKHEICLEAPVSGDLWTVNVVLDFH